MDFWAKGFSPDVLCFSVFRQFSTSKGQVMAAGRAFSPIRKIKGLRLRAALVLSTGSQITYDRFRTGSDGR
jgi:hypothetical protein